jgi:comEA protein
MKTEKKSRKIKKYLRKFSTHLRIICIWVLGIAGLWLWLHLNNRDINPPGVVIAQIIVHEETKIEFDEQMPDFTVKKEPEEVKKEEGKTVVETVRTPSRAPAKKGIATVNINTAGQKELVTLPGIGPATAQRIIDFRETNGNFAKIEDLMKVSGIGAKRFEAVKELLEL